MGKVAARVDPSASVMSVLAQLPIFARRCVPLPRLHFSLLDHQQKLPKTCTGHEMKLGVTWALDVQRQLDRLLSEVL